ncbi:MAG: hypothetical protein Q7J04_08455 [Microcella sp.]|nr:hypothetical protein [Microcella sp.]
MSGSARLVTIAGSLGLLAALGGCSGPGSVTGEFDGCLVGDRGTIAIGVTNSGGETLTISAVTVADGSGIEVADPFIALDDEARDTPAVFTSGGRDEFGGVDLDRAAIEPGGAAFVGIEVHRTGAADGLVAGLVVTVDGAQQRAPVSLALRDSCG